MQESIHRMTRRSVITAASLGPLLAVGSKISGQTTPSGYLFYVGTYTNGTSKGIYAFRFQNQTGEITALGTVAETPNPTFLALSGNHQFLYAANEIANYENTHSGLLSAFVINHLDGKLKPVNSVASAGSGPCHVAVDRTGSVLLDANYGSGSAASFHLSRTGEIGGAVSQFQFSGEGADKRRQKGPHAHCATVSPEGRHVLINDLGLDRIVVYQLDPATAKLTPNDPPYWSAKPGSGPRHLAFHPKGRYAYSINELNSTVDVLRWDGKTGTLTSLQNITTLPEGFTEENTGAEIAVDSSGRHVYASNRGHDSIAVFSIDPARGTLTAVDHTKTGGAQPRHFTLDPSGKWLLAANQKTGNIVVFRRDLATGKLTNTGKSVEVDQPVCILFA